MTLKRSPDKRRCKGYYGIRLDPDALSEFPSGFGPGDDEDEPGDDQSDIPF